MGGDGPWQAAGARMRKARVSEDRSLRFIQQGYDDHLGFCKEPATNAARTRSGRPLRSSYQVDRQQASHCDQLCWADASGTGGAKEPGQQFRAGESEHQEHRVRRRLRSTEQITVSCPADAVIPSSQLKTKTHPRGAPGRSNPRPRRFGHLGWSRGGRGELRVFYRSAPR